MGLRVLFFGNGPRGVACLGRVLRSGHQVCAVVTHSGNAESSRLMKQAASDANIDCVTPDDPNRPDFVTFAAAKGANVTVLAGYSLILTQGLIDAASIMAINTHAGELPGMRGSSPLNWALIEGHKSVTLSVIQVSTGIDAGNVLAERSLPVTELTTIVDLQDAANSLFPEMIVSTLDAIAAGTVRGRVQGSQDQAYYPLRFPDDGLILWDQLTAIQAHNRIRALTEPYPCAFTYGNGHRIKLLQSELTTTPYMGEPGRIYRKSDRGLLVCASDRCVWITRAVDSKTGKTAGSIVNRYDRLATMREAAMRFYEAGVSA